MAVRTDPLQNIVNVSWGSGLGPWLRLTLYYSSAEFTEYDDWHAYKWQAIPPIAPGYVVAFETGSLFNVGSPEIFSKTGYAQTSGLATYNPQIINPGNTGYGSQVLFNLKNLVGSDSTTYALTSEFIVDFETGANYPGSPPGETIFMFWEITKPGPQSQRFGEHGAPDEPHSILVASGDIEDNGGGRPDDPAYWQITIGTDLSFSYERQFATPF